MLQNSFKNSIKAVLANIKNNRKNRFALILSISVIIASIFGSYLISNNESRYNKAIAKVIKVTEENNTSADGTDKDAEGIRLQQIEAVIMNGTHKGEKVNLKNTASSSQTFSMNYKVNDEIFVTIHENSDHKISASMILEFKRDKYIAYVTILFIVLILLIGGFKGFRSLISVSINVIIFSVMIELLLHGYYPLLTAAAASILFIILSISIVSGVNKKTASAVIGTIVGTLTSMLIAAAVIYLTNTKGIGYQETDFLSNLPPKANFTVEQIFFIEILIGTLGAIMDIAISISSSLNEISEKNPGIDTKMLVKSGMEIGKDIMGTMANTLVFAYISGSIPLILILLKNNMPIFGIINYNISLEIIRALTGSIGIVVSIPITIYFSVILLKNKRIGARS